MSKTMKTKADQPEVFNQTDVFTKEAGFKGVKQAAGADPFDPKAADLYEPPLEVTRDLGDRGVSLTSGDLGQWSGGQKDVRKGPPAWFDAEEIKDPPKDKVPPPPPPVQQDFSNQPSFTLDDVPPPKPSDGYFKFEVTTQFVDSSEPHTVGNFLLDFFNTQVSATYLKNVKHKKYAIKVDVFVDTMMCTMKTRIYKLGELRHAIEFQRRCGDTIAFNGTYQKACQYLRRRASECKDPKAKVLVMEKWEEPPPIFSFEPLVIPVGEEIQITKEEMIPLLDMTSLKGAPWLQAEAATSLSKMAEEKNKVLHDDRVFQSVHELVQVDSTDVAHPTSCLVWHLAGQDEAQKFFASTEIPNFPKQVLLMTVLWKILLDVTHPQVKLKLAQALNLSLKNLTARLNTEGVCYLGCEEAKVMFDEMGFAMRTKDLGNETMNELKSAHLNLEKISDTKRSGYPG